MNRFLPFVTVLLLCTAGVRAADTAFTYQGQLTQAGTPANGVYDLQFSLFGTASGGSVLAGPLAVNAVPVTNGLFTVTLDFTAAPFDGSSRWLEIGVRPGNGAGVYTTLTPRQWITPAPYAMQAATAGSVPAAGVAGTLPDQRLSSNVALLSSNATFAGNLGTAGDLTAARLNAGSAGVLNGIASSIVGGANNQVYSDFSTIAGGTDNRIETNSARTFIGGGNLNRIAANSTFSAIGGGNGNLATNTYVTIAGGVQNTGSGTLSFIGGGNANLASANSAVVVGGYQNAATNASATLGGGDHNLAGGYRSVVAGGGFNTVPGEGSALLGGSLNQVTGAYSTLGGGYHNQDDAFYGFLGGGTGNVLGNYYGVLAGGEQNSVSGYGATISGGSQNTNTAEFGTIAGGLNNQTPMSYGTIGGGMANSTWMMATVAGGGVNSASGNSSAIGGGWQNYVSQDYGVIAGGAQNTNLSTGGVIVGGLGNRVSGNQAFIGGGYQNFALSPGAVMVGGTGNNAAAPYSFIGGGSQNSVSQDEAVVAGGRQNAAEGKWAAVGGGLNNRAGGWYATVPGGATNFATGIASFAAGTGANAYHNNSFVWSDSVAAGFSSTSTNQFSVRAVGGVRFVTEGAGLTVDDKNVLTGSTVGNQLVVGSALSFTNVADNFSGTFTGSGAGLTALNASQLSSGTVPLARLPAGLLTNNATGVTLGGTFAGNGAGLTNLSGASLSGPLTNLLVTNSVFAGDGRSVTNVDALTLGGRTPASFAAATNPVIAGTLTAADARVTGLVRAGSETGTTDAPNYGMLFRRISSLTRTAGAIVARTDELTLERDGSYGGFLIRYPANTQKRYTINCTGLSYYGTNILVRTTVTTPASAGTVQVVTDSQRPVHLQVSFGDAFNAGHFTTAVMDRFDDGSPDYYWVGHLISSYNQ